MAPGAWLNPAGGLRYHTRALFGSRLWAPFRRSLGVWLSGFEPGAGRAILVGPSAAHCISDAFLRRFSDVTALEPDPLAGFLLARRLRALGIAAPQIERHDWLIRPLLEGTSGLADLLSRSPGACVVFCNVLGQTRFLMTDLEFVRFKAAFRARILSALEGRAWLSFHDRLSGALTPELAAPYLAPSRLSDAAVLEQFYRSETATGTVELLDHGSDGFFPSELPHAYFSWQIDRAQNHLIEGVASSAPRSAR